MNDEWQIPDALMARCLGRIDRVQRVLDVYLTQMDEDVNRLGNELNVGNSTEICKIAHRIKGASANAAVESIRADAESIEQLAAANQLDGLQDCIERLKEDLREITDSVARLLEASVTGAADGA